MTLEEFKRTGKSGIYCADLDEWFVDGEEPADVVETPEALSTGLDVPEPAPVSEAPKKTTKVGKDHD